MNGGETWCWDCEHEFKYTEDDVFMLNDIIEGQYVEYFAVQCPKCGMSNKVY